MNPLLIDFSIEKWRHKNFFGREDILSELNRLIELSREQGGYVLLQGGPGSGKSAIMWQWLQLQLQRGEIIPHHFIRRGYENWDQPMAVLLNIISQIAQIYPKQNSEQLTDSIEQVSRAFRRLLERISCEELQPQRKTLIILLDALDEIDIRTGEILSKILASPLPPYIVYLCSSKPNYPKLLWLEAQTNLSRIDLSSNAWELSNKKACHDFWIWHAGQLTPPLSTEFIEEITLITQGNMLHAVLLLQEFRCNLNKSQIASKLPRGLHSYFEYIWQEMKGLSNPMQDKFFLSLGLLCLVKEPMPLSVLEILLGTNSVHVKELVLEVGRPVLQEIETEHESNYTYYHDSFRGFLTDKLGDALINQCKNLLLQSCKNARTSPIEQWLKSYAVKYIIVHATEFQDWETVYELFTDIDYIDQRIRLYGITRTEFDLDFALHMYPVQLTESRSIMSALYSAIRYESHWLVQSVPLKDVLYNQLRCQGWDHKKIYELLGPNRNSSTEMRLMHPIHRSVSLYRTMNFQEHLYCCCLTPDGKYILSGGASNRVRISELETGIVKFQLVGHQGWILTCAITQDAKYIISGSTDHRFMVWDLSVGQGCILIEESANVESCLFTRDETWAISACIDGSIRIWDYRNKKKVSDLGMHKSVTSLAVLEKAALLVSASLDGSIKIWDLTTNKEIYSYEGWGCRIDTCNVMPNEELIIFGLGNGTLKAWNLKSREIAYTLTVSNQAISSCALTHDGKRLLVGSRDGVISLWDLSMGHKRVASFSEHSSNVEGCAFTPDEKMAISASLDGTIRVWNLEQIPIGLTDPVEKHLGRIEDCKIFSERELITVGEDRMIRRWDIESGKMVDMFSTGHNEGITACAVFDQNKLATASYDTSLKLWNLNSHDCLTTLLPNAGIVRAFCITPDEGHLIAGSDSGKIHIWDMKKLDESPEDYATHNSYMLDNCMNSYREQEIICTSMLDETINIWNLKQKRVVSSIAGYGGAGGVCALSAQKLLLAFSGPDATILIWSISEQRQSLVLTGHRGLVASCAFIKNDTMLVSASWDHQLKLWDLSTGSCLSTVYGVAPFLCVSIINDHICAGDGAGNVWFLKCVTLSQMHLSAQEHRPSVVDLTTSLQKLLLPPLDLPPTFFLHLSDLHFQSTRQVTLFIDALEADLNELSDLVPRLDGVVLSGDLTQVATPAEFTAAEAFLRELRNIYKLRPQQLVLVPGNHDGNWDRSRAAYPDPLPPGSQPDEMHYQKRFEAFANFYQSVCEQSYPLEFERQATLHQFEANKVLFLGLNSAWQCDHLPEHQGRASIHEGALASGLQIVRREPRYTDWLKIAVWHHPVQSDGEDRIKNIGFLDRLAQAGFRLGMHGHMHMAQTTQHAYDMTANGRRLRLLGAGTFGAPTRDWRSGIPLQYQILCIQKARFKVLSRCRDNPEGPWRADGRWVVGAETRSYYEDDL